MNKNLLTATIALGLALSTTSCITQTYSSPRGNNLLHSELTGAYHGDHADTGNYNKPINVDSTDVQVICPRAVGKSTGFKLLGFIPVRLASETEAVNNMYQDARDRGCPPKVRPAISSTIPLSIAATTKSCTAAPRYAPVATLSKFCLLARVFRN